MPGMNREDVAQYRALWLALTRVEVAMSDIHLELIRQTNCPRGHPFIDSSRPFPANEEGKVTGAPTNLHVDPDGRVVCRLCRNERGLAYRQQIADGKIRGVMTRRAGVEKRQRPKLLPPPDATEDADEDRDGS